MKTLPAGIDIGGLLPHDQRLIAKHGVWAWMDAMARKSGASVPMSDPARAKDRKVRKVCTVCSEGFYSRRSDAQFCGPNCRAFASRQQRQMSQIAPA